MKSTESNASSRKGSWAAQRKSLKPKTFDMSSEALVRIEQVRPDLAVPLVVTPNLPGVDLPSWAENNLDFIEQKLAQCGGLLFRGFGLRGDQDLDNFLRAIRLDRMHYMEGATPRVELREKVYTSTEYPSDQWIALHNELNYVLTWPMKIFFFCVTPPESGGETPIADVRKVYERLDPKTRQRFSEKGWMLVRNFGEHMSLPWQSSFRLTEPAELEDYCRKSRIEWRWKDNGNLRTQQVRPAMRQHPRTGEWVWFNHVAFWHDSSLDPTVRSMFLSEFGKENLPYNTYYGDGQTIEDSVVEELREAYRQETVAVPWQQGDLLMLDNMLVAHGRNPFTGIRRILAAMGEPCHDGTLSSS